MSLAIHPDNSVMLFRADKELAWNPVEMSLLGYNPIITGQTSVSDIMHTIRGFNIAYGGQWPPASIGQKCTDQNGKTVPCPSDQDNNQPSTGTRGYEPPEDGRVIPPEAKPGAPPSLELGVPDTGARNLDVDDWIKRGALILIALVIIAAAVVSLR